MMQTYYCLSCSSPVIQGNRFCGNCGIHLNWPIQQPVVPPIAYQQTPNYQYGYYQQQPGLGYQPSWGQSTEFNTYQNQKQNVSGYVVRTSKRQSSPLVFVLLVALVAIATLAGVVAITSSGTFNISASNLNPTNVTPQVIPTPTTPPPNAIFSPASPPASSSPSPSVSLPVSSPASAPSCH